MSYETIVKEGNFYQSATGDYGFRLLSGGDSSTAGESFRSIQALQDSVVTTTTLAGDALTSVTLTEGMVVFGKFDSVAVASGKVLAYKAVL
jgi:hypothetical protein